MRGSRGARAPGYLCRAARCRRGARPATSGCRSSDDLRVAPVVANHRSYPPSSVSPELTTRCGWEGTLGCDHADGGTPAGPLWKTRGDDRVGMKSEFEV